MIYKEMSRIEMISALLCDETRLYDPLDVGFFVDSLIRQAEGEHLLWDADHIWDVYCEARKVMAEEELVDIPWKTSETH